ncbi:DUF1566 domain-containing protein [bacterium]|nr:DUF1566 domain-containing protein [bacterium]
MRNTIILLVISVLTFCFVSCGEEENATARIQKQPNGTVLNRTVVVRPEKEVKIPMLKKPSLPPVNTQTWPMIATGLTKCYDNTKEIDCSEVPDDFAGQDGQKRYGTRSLVKENNNEIVYDNVSKLRWTKRINSDLNWYEAKAYCESLKLNNKTWRIPTTAELRSIVNYGKVNPALDKIFYEDASGSAVSDEAEDLKAQLSDWFWATKHVHFDSETDVEVEGETKKRLASSWIINFYDGFVEYTSRYNKYNVRCVSSDN